MEIIKTYRTRRSTRGITSSPNLSATSSDAVSAQPTEPESATTTAASGPATPNSGGSAAAAAPSSATPTVTTRRSAGRNAAKSASSSQSSAVSSVAEETPNNAGAALAEDNNTTTSASSSTPQQSQVSMLRTTRRRRGSSSSTSSTNTTTSSTTTPASSTTSQQPVRRSVRAAAAAHAHIPPRQEAGSATTKPAEQDGNGNAPPANLNHNRNQRISVDEKPNVSAVRSISSANNTTTTKTIDDATKTSDSNIDGGGDGKSGAGSKVGSQTNGNNNKRKIYVSSNKASLALSAGEQDGNQLETEVAVKTDALEEATNTTVGVSSTTSAVTPAILEIEKSILAKAEKGFKVNSNIKRGKQAGGQGEEGEEEVEPDGLPPILLVDGATGLPLVGNYSSADSSAIKETSSASSEDGSTSSVRSFDAAGESPSPKQFNTYQLTVGNDGTIYFNPTAPTDVPGE